jgi:hypothetical protein
MTEKKGIAMLHTILLGCSSLVNRREGAELELEQMMKKGIRPLDI